MWKRSSLPFTLAPDWTALRDQPHFLFRQVEDRDHAVLAVGLEPEAEGDGWTYGHLTYRPLDVGVELPTRHPEAVCFPRSIMTTARFVIEWADDSLWLHAPTVHLQEARDFAEVFLRPVPGGIPISLSGWSSRTSREGYLTQAERLMRAIQRGDIYEVNYCIEHFTHAPGWDPFLAFPDLLERSEAPFAAFYRRGSHFALSASPERFLRIEGDHIMGEPMKGTRPRGGDPASDRALALSLAQDPKERAENIMALDVMRHDLSRVAAPGSVRVEALCDVRSHPRVHQMTSTITARLRAGLDVHDVLNAAFPMASMTGAPKESAMKLIDAAEDMPRGLYSGALGFFSPDGVADLSVVIRTVVHDALTGYTSLCAGSALTAACDPGAEWEECLLKFRSVADLLDHDR